MTRKKKETVLVWSGIVTWFGVTALAKSCLFPERSFFELLITGFFANSIACAIVCGILSAIIKVDEHEDD